MTKFHVISKMTIEEYEKAKALAPERDNYRPQIVALAHNLVRDVWEQDIPVAVADALQILPEAPQELKDSAEAADPITIDVSQWPVHLKLEALRLISGRWTPRHEDQQSFWEYRDDAHSLLHHLPELQHLFTKTPEEVKDMWLKRNFS